MENPHITDNDTLSDEVEIELDMLRALMLYGVGGEVHGTDVVKVDKGAPSQRTVQLLEELTKPRRLGDAVSHSAVLNLGARAGDDRLPLQGPGDEAVAVEHGETEGGPMRVRIAGPVGVGVDDKVGGSRPSKEEVELGGAPEVSQDPLHSGEMWLPWGVHIEAHLLDDVGDVGASEDEVLQGRVLQGPGETPIAGRISYRRAVVEGYLALSVHRSRVGLTISHASALEAVDGVLALVEEQALGPVLGGDP
jgi:hypothetical protein